MKKRLPAGAFVAALVLLVAWVTASVSPAAYSVYRCQAMAATLTRPCCASMAAAQRQSGGAAGLRADRCCTREEVSLDRAPSELATRHSDDSLQRLPLANAVLAAAFAPAAPTPPGLLARGVWERLAVQAGPPLWQKTCSLLI